MSTSSIALTRAAAACSGEIAVEKPESLIGASNGLPSGSGCAKLPSGWLQHGYVEFDDSDTSSDGDEDSDSDCGSFSSQDSDDTIVSDEVTTGLSDESSPRPPETSASHVIRIAFTGPPSGVSLQRPGCTPRGARALPTARQSPKVRWDERSLIKPVPIAPLRSLNLDVPLRRHSISASLTLRHAAALRAFQLKQEERELARHRAAMATASRSRLDEQYDIVGITSYPRPAPPSVLFRTSRQGRQRSAGDTCRPQSRQDLAVEIAALDGPGGSAGHVRSRSHEADSDHGVAMPLPALCEDERHRAGLHLLRTLGQPDQSQLRTKVAPPANSTRKVSRHRRPPSLDEITLRIGGGHINATGDAGVTGGRGRRSGCLGQRPRSASCPSPVIGDPTLREVVEVFVTPPTPRPDDVDHRVHGVVLLRSPGSAPLQTRQSFLAAPAFDVAPGRTKALEESQRMIDQLSLLVAQQQGFLLQRSGVSAQTGQATAPAEADCELPRQDPNGSNVGNDRDASLLTLPNDCMAQRTCNRPANADEQRTGCAVPKYVAPGRRGYGQAGKGFPSTSMRRAAPQRQVSLNQMLGSVSARASLGAMMGYGVNADKLRGSHTPTQHAHTESGAMECRRATVRQSMLERLELRRRSSSVVSHAAR
ncbi:uncharacterized protein PSFLO_05575 [Pseudozyma flocculosa]|nr:uncharacterized protein PSFLO_05575 [Pseudozyma flocculosa]